MVFKLLLVEDDPEIKEIISDYFTEKIKKMLEMSKLSSASFEINIEDASLNDISIKIINRYRAFHCAYDFRAAQIYLRCKK
ncbi:hypothetical protein [Sedimentibacter hydroxybenzoicus]|uniref:hypothetical protein n=1 Tax=Sedimentibacter hydroxybenzoicus TaxID=29345 RepID=UPI002ADE4A7A|nr:hypothetical protein [Sedimentibacter hydroxybenzoicus]